MSFFEGQDAGWSQRHSRQQSWDQSNARLGGSVSSQQQDDGDAFRTQYEEVARAVDNLSKSGKFAHVGPNMHGRRESMPAVGTFQRQLADFSELSATRTGPADADAAPPGPRGGPSRHFSVSEDPSRSHSSHPGVGLSGYLAHQRFGPRPSEAEQVMQAKRRAAAQRERELRNYHQEQQYNRSGSRASQPLEIAGLGDKDLAGSKSDRSMSPNAAMSEEDRRELIARQHRALYGNDSQLYTSDGASTRPLSQDARVLAATSSPHGSSPLGFGMPSGSTGESGPAMQVTTGQSSTRASSATPPSTGATQFAMFDNNSQQGPKSSSPGSSPAPNGSKAGPANGVAPIGTRPAQIAGKSGNRGTPSAPSPLGFNGVNASERSQPAASNPSNGNGEKGVGLGWSGTNGPWSSKMQASVWG